MDRSVLDRWTDTTVFRLALLLSGMAVLPVLALGAFVTVIGGTAMVYSHSTVELEEAVFGLLSVGGILGFFGYLRAHVAAKNPARLSVTATLIFLAAGVAAALVVAGYSAFGTLYGLRNPWGLPMMAVPSALFSAANVVWAVSGVAWMNRLSHRYAETTGRAFDTLPAVLLLVVLVLATAAVLKTATL